MTAGLGYGLVLDTRHVDRDRLDRQTIARAVARHAMTIDFEYTHRGSRDEPLLSLPDAIGWAWGAGGRWREAVAPLIASTRSCDAN